MKRTIKLSRGLTEYRDKRYRGIISCILKHFKMLERGKYVITITEGSRGKYHFSPYSCGIWHLMDATIAGDDGWIGGFCCDAFTEIFFKPVEDKRYNITVKRVG